MVKFVAKIWGKEEAAHVTFMNARQHSNLWYNGNFVYHQVAVSIFNLNMKKRKICPSSGQCSGKSNFAVHKY